MVAVVPFAPAEGFEPSIPLPILVSLLIAEGPPISMSSSDIIEKPVCSPILPINECSTDIDSFEVLKELGTDTDPFEDLKEFRIVVADVINTFLFSSRDLRFFIQFL